MQLIQNVKQLINNRLPIKQVRSTISLYMVRVSVFLENKVYVYVVEIFEDRNSRFNVIKAGCVERIHGFISWLIESHKLSAKGGAAPFSYDSRDAKRTFGVVALLHLLVFLMVLGLSAIYNKKVPNVTIELENISSVPEQPVVNREEARPQPVKELPKELPKELAKEPVITQKIDPEIIRAQELKRVEKKKELEREKLLAKEREQEKKRELDRQKQIAKELEQEKKNQLDLDKKKARELEQEKKRELDRQRQMAKELELEKKRQADLDRQKAKELEQEKKRELDRQKQVAKEMEQEKRREQLRDQQQREKLAESKKVDKDGTLPPPPSSAASGSSQAGQSSAGGAGSPASSSATSSTSSGSSSSLSASVSSASASSSSGTGSDSDAKASYLNNPKPSYPLVAHKMKIEGKVILIVEVTEGGVVNRVSVGESSGNESLDRSALEAVKNWKFTPARKNGVTVAQVVRVPITFSLKNR